MPYGFVSSDTLLTSSLHSLQEKHFFKNENKVKNKVKTKYCCPLFKDDSFI
jgi:hypothetical protein